MNIDTEDRLFRKTTFITYRKLSAFFIAAFDVFQFILIGSAFRVNRKFDPVHYNGDMVFRPS